MKSTPHARALRLAISLREPLKVLCGGVLLAVAMIYGCSSESEPHPPPGGGDCTGHCSAGVVSGGSQVSTGGTVDQGDASGGAFGDVNGPAFDGNFAPVSM